MKVLGGARIAGNMDKLLIPYVTDGLISMWDGEWNVGIGKHDPNATIWKDLVGNYDIASLDGSWESNRFTSQDGVSFTYVPYFELMYNKTLTMEFCFIIPSFIGYPYPTLFRYGSSRNNQWYCRDNVIFKWLWIGGGLSNMTGVFNNLNEPVQCAINVSTDRLWVNGVDRIGFSNLRYTDIGNNVMMFGALNIPLHSIRIYNRGLTQQEIRHNYSVDKYRFNIP